MSSDVMRRLPRHPDWKYEMIDGEAWLSPRARPLLFRRSISVAVPMARHSDAQIRMIDARRDRTAVIELVRDVWAEEDPYRSLEDPYTLLENSLSAA